VYPSSARELQQRLANSTTLMMEGVGHLPYEELPAEFNHVVCEFLLRSNPRTPPETAPCEDSRQGATLVVPNQRS
jgi:hypothetical protein